MSTRGRGGAWVLRAPEDCKIASCNGLSFSRKLRGSRSTSISRLTELYSAVMRQMSSPPSSIVSLKISCATDEPSVADNKSINAKSSTPPGLYIIRKHTQFLIAVQKRTAQVGSRMQVRACSLRIGSQSGATISPRRRLLVRRGCRRPADAEKQGLPGYDACPAPVSICSRPRDNRGTQHVPRRAVTPRRHPCSPDYELHACRRLRGRTGWRLCRPSFCCTVQHPFCGRRQTMADVTAKTRVLPRSGLALSW